MSCTYALLKNNLYATYKLVTYVLEILITIRRFFENCVIWAAFFLEATYPNSNCYENVSHVGITVSIFSPIFNLTFSYDHENSMTIKRQRQKRKEEIENVVFTSLQWTTDHFWHGLQWRKSSCFTLFSRGSFFFLAFSIPFWCIWRSLSFRQKQRHFVSSFFFFFRLNMRTVHS